MLTTWAEWRFEHPDTTVLDFDTGYDRQYLPGVPYDEYFTSTGLWFPVPEGDQRLQDKTQIFALEVNGSPKAYPVDTVLAEQAVNDELGGVDIVIVGSGENIEVNGVGRDGLDFSYQAGGAIRAYERDGHVFTSGIEPAALIDEQGNVWAVTEDALIGPVDQRLSRLPGHLAFWFGWSSFFPDTDVYRP